MTATPTTATADTAVRDEAGRLVRTTVHSVLLTIDPRAAYATLADVSRWPFTFGPTVHVAREDAGPGRELLDVWALAHGEVRHWTSRRELDEAELTIRFRQEASPAPLASMGGRWTVHRLGDGMCRVVLDHDYTLLDDGPGVDEADLAEVDAYVRGAVDQNSTAELGSLAEACDPSRAGTIVSFSDTVTTDGAPDDVYAFLRDAGAWPDRLPHVSRLELTEPEPGVQVMEMDTAPPDGEVHTTRSVRICLPPGEIVYKQTTLPPVFAAHVGRWTVVPTDAGTEVTSHHTVVLRPDRIADVLGPDGTLEQARLATRDALGANSRTTLARAAAFATGQ